MCLSCCKSYNIHCNYYNNYLNGYFISKDPVTPSSEKHSRAKLIIEVEFCG
jgi:hypothetical protein